MIKLILFYNTKSTFLSGVKNILHKIISPKTYKCRLFKITHKNILKKKEWQNFLNKLPYQKVFLHTDELANKFPHLKQKKLPAIFLLVNDEMKPLVTTKEIKKIEFLDDLQKLIEIRISKLSKKNNWIIDK